MHRRWHGRGAEPDQAGTGLLSGGSTERAQQHITLLELLFVLNSVQTFRHELRGHTVQLWENNQAVVAILKSWTTKSPDMMRVLRKLWLLLDSLNITLVARYIRSADTVQADELSRRHDPGDWRVAAQRPGRVPHLEQAFWARIRYTALQRPTIRTCHGSTPRWGIRRRKRWTCSRSPTRWQRTTGAIAVERARPPGAAPARDGSGGDRSGPALARASVVPAAAGTVLRLPVLAAAGKPLLSRSAGLYRAHRAVGLANHLLPHPGPLLMYWLQQSSLQRRCHVLP